MTGNDDYVVVGPLTPLAYATFDSPAWSAASGALARAAALHDLGASDHAVAAAERRAAALVVRARLAALQRLRRTRRRSNGTAILHQARRRARPRCRGRAGARRRTRAPARAPADPEPEAYAGGAP